MTWDIVTLEKEDGGLGTRDFQTLDDVAAIREVTILWEEGLGGAWSSWMKDCYVRGLNFNSITRKS